MKSFLLGFVFQLFRISFLMPPRMIMYYVFFTTQHTKTCLEHCCFGASILNPLANVRKGDIAFVFDGQQRSLFGPLEIVSEEQYIDERPIYGRDKRGKSRYKHRVWFKIEVGREIPIVDLYSTERDAYTIQYTLNRNLIATLMANKQVSATPLTQSEGLYLIKRCIALGKPLRVKSPNIPVDSKPVLTEKKLRLPVSEATVEVLILKKECQGYLFEFLTSLDQQAVYFNQFVFGFQRQCDILIDAGNKLVIAEIKRASNAQNPYKQIVEYLFYCLSSFRLYVDRLAPIKEIDLLLIIENGNKFLDLTEVKSFIKRCSKIANRENIVIVPHTIIYEVSGGMLTTRLCDLSLKDASLD